MRALWIVGLVPNKMGGFERTCAEFARQAQPRGCTAEFVFEGEPCPALASELTNSAAAYCVIPKVGELGWAQAISLWAHFRKRRPDVVHLHFCEFYVPFFVMLSALRIPFVATYHYSGEPTRASTLLRFAKRVRLILFSGSLQQTTAVSNSARQKFLADYLERPERVTVIHNGTEVACPSEGAMPQTTAPDVADKRRPKVLFVGSLSPEKGADIALQAIRRVLDTCPEATLSIVGEGVQKGRLKQMADELGLSNNVFFLGLRDDVREILARHDMFVMPSIWKEAFGYVLIEAMAAGCPVIASAVGGIPEVIGDREEGILVPPGDPGALASAIETLWNNPEFRSNLIANALRKVRRSFSMEKIVSSYWRLYN